MEYLDSDTEDYQPPDPVDFIQAADATIARIQSAQQGVANLPRSLTENVIQGAEATVARTQSAQQSVANFPRSLTENNSTLNTAPIPPVLHTVTDEVTEMEPSPEEATGTAPSPDQAASSPATETAPSPDQAPPSPASEISDSVGVLPDSPIILSRHGTLPEEKAVKLIKRMRQQSLRYDEEIARLRLRYLARGRR